MTMSDYVRLGLWSAGVALTASFVDAAQSQVLTKDIYSFPAVVRHSGSSALAADASGALYGLTESGGQPAGYGVIFRLVPPVAKGSPWTEQTLANLDDASGSPVLDAAGNVYGTVTYGPAAADGGAVWKLSPPGVSGGNWILTFLYAFSLPGTSNINASGAYPATGVVLGRSGRLYGLTRAGGSAGDGVIFSLTPPRPGETRWREQVLHNFSAVNDTTDGGSSLTLSPDERTLTGAAPIWYNAEGAFHEGGAIYRLGREGNTWAYRPLYQFRRVAGEAFPGGARPEGTLVVDANDDIFGVTKLGGSSTDGIDTGVGTVFELSPPALGQSAWTEQVLHAFTGADGQWPVAGLITAGSPPALFGTAPLGGSGGAVDGSDGGQGVTFRLDPPAGGSGGPWTYTELHGFQVGNVHQQDGGAGYIYNGLTVGKDGFLFGVALAGGAYRGGAVFAQPPQ